MVDEITEILETALANAFTGPTGDNLSVEVYGSVWTSASNKEYDDQDILHLVDSDIGFWRWGGDQSSDESNICIVLQRDGEVLEERNFVHLNEALAYLKDLRRAGWW